MRALLPAALIVALLTACGGQSLDDAVAALQKSYDAGDDAKVLADAPAVRTQADSEGASAQGWRVETLVLKAKAREGKGSEVVTDLAALKATHAAKIDAQLYSQLMKCAQDGSELAAAVTIGDAALKAFPEQKAYFDPLMKDLANKAAAADDPSMEALKSLGYLGGGSTEDDDESP